MTPSNELRKIVKEQWPHVRVKTKTVSFSDFARASAVVFAEIEGVKNPEEFRAIKEAARKLDIIAR